MIGFAHGPNESLAAAPDDTRVLFAIASLDMDRWGDAELVVPRLKDPVLRGLADCYLAGKRTDIDGERRCLNAIKAAEGATGLAPWLVDSAQLGLAASIERNNRLEAAAAVLQGLVRARPNVRNRKALHGFYDRVGWVKEAIAALDEWAREMPDDPSVKGQLVGLLERKVKGDLLDGRGKEAEEAARRLMALEPANGTWGYYLADALDAGGNKDEAAKVRAAAVATGASPPKAPNAIRDTPPTHPGHTHTP